MRRVETSMFWMSIIDQLAVDLNKHKIGLNYLPYSAFYPPGTDFFQMLSPDKTDGVIVVNIYDTDLLTRIAEAPVPKVYYDTVPEYKAADLNGDLLLVDGRDTVAAITDKLISEGCKQLGFIGDIHYARTNHLRYQGFLDSCKKNRIELNPVLSYVEPLSDNPEADITEFLYGLTEMPDCFVCVSDYTAFLVLNLLRGMGRSENVTITGFDDSKEFMLEYANITTVRVQKSMLGRRLINQLLYRIENPEADYEEILIQPKVIYR
jgi:LacI family transcriptional regulator